MTSVLAVDDSRSMRQLLARTLRNAAATAWSKRSTASTRWKKLAAQPADVVLTDQNMPRMDGLALTRALRADARWSALPVLILTTEDGDAVRQAGRAAGATGWLGKPFDPARLLQVLQEVTHPRSAGGASPSRGRHQRPGEAGSAVAHEVHGAHVPPGMEK